MGEWRVDPFDALASAFAALTAATPGFSVISIGRPGALLAAVSSIQIALFNRVMGVRLRDEEVEQAIEAVRAAHARAGVPGSWWLDPHSTPAALPEALERGGYVGNETVPAMAISLESDLREPELPDGARLTWVAGREQMRAAQRMVGIGFGMPPAFAEDMADRLADMGRQPGPARVVVATLDGEAVASATASTADEVTGVYSVVTLPKARGKGPGRAVTVAVLRDARERGARMGVLESTEMGFPVYARIGFEHVGDFRLFVSGKRR